MTISKTLIQCKTSGGIVYMKFLQVMVTCKCGNQQVGTGESLELAIRDACRGHQNARYNFTVGNQRRCHILKGKMMVITGQLRKIYVPFLVRIPLQRGSNLDISQYLNPVPLGPVLQKTAT